AMRKQPTSFVSTTSRKPPGSTLQNGCGSDRNRGLTVRMPIPALLTSMSTPPQASWARSTHSATERSSRTSSRHGMAEEPRTVDFASARSCSRLVPFTRAPAWTSAAAMAAPKPLVAPVTRTRTPFSRLTALMTGTQTARLGAGVSLSTGRAATSPVPDVEDEAQDHEGPAPTADLGHRVVGKDVETGRQ